MPEAFYDKSRSVSIKLQKSLHELKQSGWTQYNNLNKYLLEKGFENNEIWLCIFIKRTIFEIIMLMI